jgi:CRP-like cAMP-binding protein
MQKYLTALLNCPLFEGIKAGEMKSLMTCLGAREKNYEKDSYIFRTDEAPRYFGIVLSGALLVIQDNFWGTRSIMERIEPYGLFGAAFILVGFEKLPVSVMAAEDAEVILIEGSRITQTCQTVCAFHGRLIRNMMGNLAKKNTLLIQKLEHITKRTTREKLVSYLSSQALKAGSRSFEIPFNRQELADYLAIDRSAMSSELGRMRDEGLVCSQKNQFTLNQKMYLCASG